MHCFQVQTLEMLIQGYDEEDRDMALTALNCPFIKHMDVEYAKLARSLAVPKASQVRLCTWQACLYVMLSL